MAKFKSNSAAESSCHPLDRSDNRIRAYLASVRPMRDVDFGGETDEANQRGRSLIERLAISAADTADVPPLRLSAGQVADVLSFVHCSEPIDPANWHVDPDNEPSHLVGLTLVLSALEASLRAAEPTEDVCERLEDASSVIVAVIRALGDDHEQAAALRVANGQLLRLMDDLDPTH